MATAFCPYCGTQNLGTRFCENCGQPAAAAGVALMATGVVATGVVAAPAVYGPPPAYHYAAPGSTGARRGSPFNAVTLASYLAYLVIPTLGYLALANVSYNSGGQVWVVILEILTWGLLLISGISATIAGFTSRTTPGRRVGGGMLGVLFLLLSLLTLLSTLGGYGLFNYVYDLILAPVVLFVSWAVARPFRGPGYFALLIGVVLTVLTFAIGLIPFVQYNYWLSPLLSLMVDVIATVVTVVIAMAFEKPRYGAVPTTTAPAFAPVQPGYPVYGARTNTLAVVSLVFGIVGGGLVAVILGHIARSQIRRTGESGSGMATAGLILGYFWLAVFVIYIAYALIGLVVLYSALGSYGY